MNDALQLPDKTPQKSLLWQFGGHPKQHRTLQAALNCHKLFQICEIIGFIPEEDPKHLQQQSLLRELNLLPTTDPMEIDSENMESASDEEHCLALLTGLATDTRMKR